MIDIPETYRAVYGGGIPLRDIQSVRAKFPYDSIALERTGCYGYCPVYTVTLHRSGKADLRAESYLPALGQFVGEVDIFSYGRLCYLLERSGFTSFQDRYEAPWTDDSTCILTAVSGATRKEVSDYGAVGPIELWSIQQTIDSIRLHIEWKPAP